MKKMNTTNQQPAAACFSFKRQKEIFIPFLYTNYLLKMLYRFVSTFLSTSISNSIAKVVTRYLAFETYLIPYYEHKIHNMLKALPIETRNSSKIFQSTLLLILAAK